jgi:hypothetical protein
MGSVVLGEHNSPAVRSEVCAGLGLTRTSRASQCTASINTTEEVLSAKKETTTQASRGQKGEDGKVLTAREKARGSKVEEATGNIE